MEELKSEKFKLLFFKYSKFIIAFFLILLISLLFILFKESYSQRQEDDFDEIQAYLENIYYKDKDLYNSTRVEEIKGEAKGIDISSWQGNIDWEKISLLDIDFVMIRCSFRNLSNEEIHDDNNFKANIEAANRLNIPVGIYFYSTAISEKEAIEEASYVINQIKDYKITYPIAYDFELFNQKRTVGISDETINENALAFLKYIEYHGYKGMLYTNLLNLNNHWNINKFSDYKIWYAQYADTIEPEIPYDIWQYADNGRIDGIKGNVDLNISNVIYKEID